MSLPRKVEPEVLDYMPASDPRAIRARLDIKRINDFILQPGLMAGLLFKHWRGGEPRTLLDIGSGDGTFMLGVAQRLAPRWRGISITLLDQQNIVSQATRDGFAALGWKVETVAADVLVYLQGMKSPVDVITANIFLHHFNEERLAQILEAGARSARMVLACEPRRNKFVLGATRYLWLIGCEELCLRDAIMSVRAGFRGKEMSALWPSGSDFELQEFPTRLFTHCFVARQRVAAGGTP